jgi:WD40 repeat protein
LDGTVKLWQVSSGEELQSFNGHSRSVRSANFSPYGTQVVSASADKTVKVWRVLTVDDLDYLANRACNLLNP